MAPEMIDNLKSQGHSIGTLIMDNDSTTIDKVCEISLDVLQLS